MWFSNIIYSAPPEPRAFQGFVSRTCKRETVVNANFALIILHSIVLRGFITFNSQQFYLSLASHISQLPVVLRQPTS